MKRKQILASVAALMVLVVAVILLKYRTVFPFMSSEASAQNNASSAAGRAEDIEKSKRKPRDPRLTPLFMEDQYFLKLSSLQGYLEKNQRSARSLVAAYELTRDPSLLEELKGKSGDPEVSICLYRAAQTKEDRLNYAREYSELKPGDMAGFLLYAGELKNSNASPEEVKAVFEKGLHAETFSGGVDRGISDMREALIMSGKDEKSADIYLIGNDYTGYATAGPCVRIFKEQAVDDLKNTASVEDKVAKVRNFLEISKVFDEISPYAQGRSIFDSYRSKIAMLNQLPDDVPVDDNGSSAKELRDEIKSELASEAKGKADAFSILQKAVPEMVDQYLDKVSEAGFVEADKWLLGKAP